MQNVAQAWLVYRLSHSALLLGTAWFCSQIPVFALGSIGGVMSDRHSRHRIVVTTQILSMLQAFTLGILTLSGHVQVWHILALALALGTINAFDMPARQALIVQLANKEDLLNAISLNSAIFNAARIVGPAIAGLLVAALGEGVCFALNGVSFLAVIAALLAMRVPAQAQPNADSSWVHLTEGFRYTWRHVQVRSILMVLAATTFAGMPAVVLMPFFADDIFHRGSRGLGFLMGAMGVGAVIGTLVLARRAEISGLHKVIVYSAIATGASFILFSRLAVVLSLAGHHAGNRVWRDAPERRGQHFNPDADPGRVSRPRHVDLCDDGGGARTIWQPRGGRDCSCGGRPLDRIRRRHSGSRGSLGISCEDR